MMFVFEDLMMNGVKDFGWSGNATGGDLAKKYKSCLSYNEEDEGDTSFCHALRFFLSFLKCFCVSFFIF